jgi:hypothetical protein
MSTEYLYRLAIGLVYPYASCIERCLIVKRTPKRVVYFHVGELIDDSGKPLHPNQVPDGETRFVDRRTLEGSGYASPAGSLMRLYLSLDMCFESRRHIAAMYGIFGGGSAPNLATLKAVMIASHPDKGGTSAAFIEARRRYVAAKRGSAGHRSAP